MGDEGSQEDRGFTVVDRRGSTGGDEPERGATGGEPAAASGPKPEGEAARAGSGDALPVDFSTFVLSLGTSALYHMGLLEHPEGGERAEPDLPLAQQTIDTLAMLEEKTRGNLEEQEAKLLDNLLYELRMRFVEVKK